MSLNVPTMASMMAQGETPDILFWVGCSGSFDDRAKKITKAVVKILNACNVEFAVLGTEESCSGDPAKRAKAIVEATTYYNDPEKLAKISEDLGEPMVGIEIDTLATNQLLASRGW